MAPGGFLTLLWIVLRDDQKQDLYFAKTARTPHGSRYFSVKSTNLRKVGSILLKNRSCVLAQRWPAQSLRKWALKGQTNDRRRYLRRKENTDHYWSGSHIACSEQICHSHQAHADPQKPYLRSYSNSLGYWSTALNWSYFACETKRSINSDRSMEWAIWKYGWDPNALEIKEHWIISNRPRIVNL